MRFCNFLAGLFDGSLVVFHRSMVRQPKRLRQDDFQSCDVVFARWLLHVRYGFRNVGRKLRCEYASGTVILSEFQGVAYSQERTYRVRRRFGTFKAGAAGQMRSLILSRSLPKHSMQNSCLRARRNFKVSWSCAARDGNLWRSWSRSWSPSMFSATSARCFSRS